MDQHNTYQGDWKGVSPHGFNMSDLHRSTSHPSQEGGGHDHSQVNAHDNTFISPLYNPHSTQGQYPQCPMPHTSTQSYTPGDTQGHGWPGSQSHGQRYHSPSIPVFTTDQGSDTPQADWTSMMDRWLQESTSEEPFRAFTVPMSAETDQRSQPTHQAYAHQVQRVSATHGNSSKGKKGRGTRY